MAVLLAVADFDTVKRCAPGVKTAARCLQPCLREPGEIWQEIAGSVDEDHRE